MTSDVFSKRVPQPRNMAIFWAATLDGRSQGELAREFSISQQRVSQIVSETRQFIAVATSEQFEGVPREAQLQFGCRIQMEKLERRRRAVAAAFQASTQPVTSVKRVRGDTCGERVETVEKSQHGDWRLDRQLGEIDRQLLDTRLLLYGREWTAGDGEGRRVDAGGRMGGERVRDLSDVVDETERDLELGAVVEESGGLNPVVLRAPVSAPGTECLEPSSACVVSTADAAEAGSVLVRPNVESAARSDEPYVPRRPVFRAEPICDLTGRQIAPPTDEHRPYIRVLRWVAKDPVGKELSNPVEDGRSRPDTPEVVLWKVDQERLRKPGVVSEGMVVSDDAELVWSGERGPFEERCEVGELVGAP
jgi:hypothetical protein